MYFPEWKYGSCDLLKFTPKGPINNNPALVLIMAWCRPGDKPLSEPTMIRLLTHICVTQSYWVKTEMIRPIIPLALNHLNLQIICIWNIPKLFTSKKSNGSRGKWLQSFLATVFTLQLDQWIFYLAFKVNSNSTIVRIFPHDEGVISKYFNVFFWQSFPL